MICFSVASFLRFPVAICVHSLEPAFLAVIAYLVKIPLEPVCLGKYEIPLTLEVFLKLNSKICLVVVSFHGEWNIVPGFPSNALSILLDASWDGDLPVINDESMKFTLVALDNFNEANALAKANSYPSTVSCIDTGKPYLTLLIAACNIATLSSV